MNQVGIGQLKHAKPIATAQKPAMKLNARPNKSPAQKAAEAAQEGQLSVDILQREDQMIVISPIAGVEKSDIKVAIQDDVLTIRGERKPIEGINNKEALVQELFWGTFSRSIVLPDHIDRKNIQARVHEHMLIVTIPKTEDFKTRIIHIEDSNHQ
jgi:HSP20 family molecular chaperone IbpA